MTQYDLERLLKLCRTFIVNEIWLGVLGEAASRKGRYERRSSKKGGVFLARSALFFDNVFNGGLGSRRRSIARDMVNFEHWDEGVSTPLFRPALPGEDRIEITRQIRAEGKANSFDLEDFKNLRYEALESNIGMLRNQQSGLAQEIGEGLTSLKETQQLVEGDNAFDPNHAFVYMPKVFEALNNARRRIYGANARDKANPTVRFRADVVGKRRDGRVSDRDWERFRVEINKQTSRGMVRECAFEGLALLVFLEASKMAMDERQRAGEARLLNRAGEKVTRGITSSDALRRIAVKVSTVKVRYQIPSLDNTPLAELKAFRVELWEQFDNTVAQLKAHARGGTLGPAITQLGLNGSHHKLLLGLANDATLEGIGLHR